MLVEDMYTWQLRRSILNPSQCASPPPALARLLYAISLSPTSTGLSCVLHAVSSTISGEKLLAERLLQPLDAQADRRLGDEQPVAGADEGAGGGDFEESADQGDVHPANP